MKLTPAQYARLPGVGQAIVDAERKIAAAIAPKVLPLADAREARAMIRERDELVRAADRTYGCKLGGEDGTARR